MAILKCKMCGGELNIQDGMTVAECEYCGTTQTLPKLVSDDIANLYDRANHFRRNNDFDKAEGIYERILSQAPEDAEAYWSLVLCRYGIEYVEDPATHKRVPTVNRAQYTAIFDDENYKSAIEHADAVQRRVYEDEAAAINEIQKGILAISQKEEPFDVFICYKESDNNGRRTPDSVLATDLYHQLTNEGFKVFFARITLEDKLGTAYEPYIFAALNSAKVMVVLGTKPEYFNAVWVKNEWSRYLALVKQSGGKKVLIPAYRDMDPYDLPEEFSHLQAQDMSKLGFMQDLIRGIKKITGSDQPKPVQPQAAAVNPVSAGSADIAPLLKRMFMYLEDGEWDKANEYSERVLDKDPENAEAYVGLLMASLRVRRRDDLKNQAQPFDGNKHYQKAICFGDDKQKNELKGYIKYINDRNTEEKRKQEEEERRQEEQRKEEERRQEEEQRENTYTNAVNLMNRASTEGEYNEAASLFYSVSGHKDADVFAKKCQENAEIIRKDYILSKAKSDIEKDTIDKYYNAKDDLKTISGWKDADDQIALCETRISEIEKKIEAAKKKKKKRTIRICTVITLAIALIVAFVIVLTSVIIPNNKYNSAENLLKEERFDEAIEIFQDLGDYKNSKEYVDYTQAKSLLCNGEYADSISILKKLGDFNDSATLLESAMQSVYSEAMSDLGSGDYKSAKTLFVKLGDYKDSADIVSEYNKYNSVSSGEDISKLISFLEKSKYFSNNELLACAKKIEPLCGYWKIKSGTYVGLSSFSIKYDISTENRINSVTPILDTNLNYSYNNSQNCIYADDGEYDYYKIYANQNGNMIVDGTIGKGKYAQDISALYYRYKQ